MDKMSSVETETYQPVITAIIRKMIIVMGKDKALKLAERVPGLTVAPDGQATAGGDLDQLRQLVRAYRAAGGTMSLYLMKSAIAPVAARTRLPLPDELR